MGVLKGSSLATLLGDLKQKFAPKIGPVYSVNKEQPDGNGNVELVTVPLARGIWSEGMSTVTDAFFMRPTGKDIGVTGNRAWVQKITGHRTLSDDYEAEEREYTANVTNIHGQELEVEIDWDTFISACPLTHGYRLATLRVTRGGTWNINPETYGVTFYDGTAADAVVGSTIEIYQKPEQLAAIYQSKPTKIISTGWNLFDPQHGYARVLKYSETYGFRIAGAYTRLYYVDNISTGTMSEITVTNGAFTVPGDGYVIVGGWGADTQIWMTWSDWTSTALANGGIYEPYTEDILDITDLVNTYFPDGLLAVGDVADEIDLELKRVISRVERMSNTDSHRAAADASGRTYEADPDYIYIVRETPVVTSITTLNGEYACNDHGLETIIAATGFTDSPPVTEIIYAENLKDKLRRDVVTVRPQTWTDDEKAQARENIGAIGADGLIRASAPIVVPSTSTHVVYTCDDLTTDYVLIDWGANGVSDTAELSCTIQNHKFTLWTYSANIGGTVQPVFARTTAVTFTADS